MLIDAGEGEPEGGRVVGVIEHRDLVRQHPGAHGTEVGHCTGAPTQVLSDDQTCCQTATADGHLCVDAQLRLHAAGRECAAQVRQLTAMRGSAVASLCSRARVQTRGRHRLGRTQLLTLTTQNMPR